MKDKDEVERELFLATREMDSLQQQDYPDYGRISRLAGYINALRWVLLKSAVKFSNTL